MKNKFVVIMLVLAFIISACGSASPVVMDGQEHSTTVENNPPAQQNTPAMEEPAASTAEGSTLKADTPAWFDASLTNVHTGEVFTINDMKGKVLLVEMMAVWCTNCRRQQGQVVELHKILGERDDFLSIGLDIDLNEDAAKLKDFVEGNGFDWYYAISPAEASRDIAALYGNQFLNPPSTPMLIIDRHGVAHPLPFGIKSADDLLQALQPYLDEAL